MTPLPADHAQGPSLASRLFSSGAIALFIKVASAGTSYLMLVAFANMLHATEYGYFGYCLLYTSPSPRD